MSNFESTINEQRQEYYEQFKNYDIPQIQTEIREAETKEDYDKLDVLFSLLTEKSPEEQKSPFDIAEEVQERINDMDPHWDN